MMLEICANSLASALAAQRAGAHRIELCENLKEGGTTPSHGTLRKVRELLSIPLYVLIRPRPGHFFYSQEEFDIMKEDILHCKQLGCDGVVIGMLDQSGQVDIPRTTALVEVAAPMGVTFHRAFDSSRDGLQALENVIQCGCERILTSGLQNTAVEGASFIQELVQLAGNRIIIMPGSGISEYNIRRLIEETGATEFHTSAKHPVSQETVYQNPAIKHMGDSIEISDGQRIRRILQEMEKNPKKK